MISIRPLALLFSSCLLVHGLLNPLVATAETTFPDEDWEIATPESQGLDREKLTAAVAWLKERCGRDGVGELVVVRHGHVAWQGDAIDKRHGIWSCTKSFTSTVLGLLIDDGKCTLDTKAKDIVPELAATYPELTLRHLATMTSGYRAVGDEPQGSYTHGPSRTPFQPGEPLFSPPGSQYAYWDSAMNEFGLVLTRLAGEPLEDLFKRRIADPIGMNPAAWDWGDRGAVNGVTVNSGSGNSGGHVQITARELARFGHLYLNRGEWRGRQLISREWVEAATQVQVPTSLPWGHAASGFDGRGVYGFNWWVNGRQPNGQRLWPGAPEGAYAASGHNNNKLFVLPEWDMVIVRLGLDQADGRVSNETWGEFLRLVGRSIEKP